MGERRVYYSIEIGRNYARTVSVSDPESGLRQRRNVVRKSPEPRADRVKATGITYKAQMALRRTVNSLPWEDVPRLAFITLTFPSKWQAFCPDDEALNALRRRFVRRWRHEYGSTPVGMWVKEFTKRGAPHLHLLVGLPGQVPEVEIEGLRAYTLLRMRLESEYGKYEGRKALPPIGAKSEHGGSFALWLRTVWAEVVTGNDRGTPTCRRHHAYGVNVRMASWSDEWARSANWSKVTEYLAKEASKVSQKVAGRDFGPVGHWYGVLHGGGSWFRPYVFVHEDVPRDVWRRFVRVQKRWLRVMRKSRNVRGRGQKWERLREQGAQTFGVPAFRWVEVYAWCQRRSMLAEQRKVRYAEIRYDLETGEVLS